MNPRFISTVDADLQPVQASVRVGLAVETVGQAGRPKTITGFQASLNPLLGSRVSCLTVNRADAVVSVLKLTYFDLI